MGDKHAVYSLREHPDHGCIRTRPSMLNYDGQEAMFVVGGKRYWPAFAIRRDTTFRLSMHMDAAGAGFSLSPAMR